MVFMAKEEWGGFLELAATASIWRGGKRERSCFEKVLRDKL
jgi:hypothetical protein